MSKCPPKRSLDGAPSRSYATFSTRPDPCEETLHQRSMLLMPPGIRPSAKTAWRPNSCTASSSDRIAPCRSSRFSATGRNPVSSAWWSRESRARQVSCLNCFRNADSDLTLQSGTHQRREAASNNWEMVSLRGPDLQHDLAGLMGCAREHALCLTGLRKRQD